MIVSFLESFKYLGHLYPIAFLRVYLGYFYIDQASLHYNGEFSTQPRLSDMIHQWVPSSSAPIWYQNFLVDFVANQWQFFSTAISVTEFLIGISFLLGYLVRPFGVVAAFIGIHFLWISNPDQAMLFKALIATNLCLTWLGAGRCFGIDYYFYKKMRGWLW
jgi:thiosulfate dehydrogenase [quinone] large subunit